MEATIDLTADERAILDVELKKELDDQSRLDLGCVGNCDSCAYERVCQF